MSGRRLLNLPVGDNKPFCQTVSPHANRLRKPAASTELAATASSQNGLFKRFSPAPGLPETQGGKRFCESEGNRFFPG
jgi:hypothetical protein